MPLPWRGRARSPEAVPASCLCLDKYVPTAVAISARQVARARMAAVSANSAINKLWIWSNSDRTVLIELAGVCAGAFPCRRRSASNEY